MGSNRDTPPPKPKTRHNTADLRVYLPVFEPPLGVKLVRVWVHFLVVKDRPVKQKDQSWLVVANSG